MQWIAEAAKQVPSLVVLAGIVYFFLRYIQSKEKGSNEMAERCHKIQQDANKIIQENTRILGEVSSLLKRLNGKI